MNFKHLDDAKETYVEHLFAAWWISAKLCVASMKCFIHGIYPDIFTTDATSTCKEIIKCREIK